MCNFMILELENTGSKYSFICIISGKPKEREEKKVYK